MLFEFDRHFARTSTRQMAAQSLEDRQRDVYDSHRHRVFSLSFYMTGNEIEAEEILKDAFIRAFQKNDEPDGDAVDTALLQELEQRRVLREEAFVPVPACAGLPSRGNVLRSDLEAAIRCLPSRERLIFLLMDVEGYSAGRVAALLRMEEGSVRRTALTARMRLRAELTAMDKDGEQAA